MPDIQLSDDDRQRIAAFMRLDDFLQVVVEGLQQVWPDVLEAAHRAYVMVPPLCSSCPALEGSSWRSNPQGAWAYIAAVAKGDEHSCSEALGRLPCVVDEVFAQYLPRERFMHIAREGFKKAWGTDPEGAVLHILDDAIAAVQLKLEHDRQAGQ